MLLIWPQEKNKRSQQQYTKQLLNAHGLFLSLHSCPLFCPLFFCPLCPVHLPVKDRMKRKRETVEFTYFFSIVEFVRNGLRIKSSMSHISNALLNVSFLTALKDHQSKEAEVPASEILHILL